MSCFRKKRVVQDRLQNSRIFCERERRTIFEQKAGASEKTARENGERRFSRLTRFTRASRLRRFPLSANDCFAVYVQEYSRDGFRET